MLTRLACAALVSSSGGAPVVLDDIFEWADPARLRALGPILAATAADSQVLLFTCTPERFATVAPARVISLPGCSLGAPSRGWTRSKILRRRTTLRAGCLRPCPRLRSICSLTRGQPLQLALAGECSSSPDRGRRNRRSAEEIGPRRTSNVGPRIAILTVGSRFASTLPSFLRLDIICVRVIPHLKTSGLFKRTALVAVGVVLVWASLAAGYARLDSTSHGLKVVATTTRLVVREVAGEDVELTVLLKAGADSHSYDPSPQAVVKVADADLILKNGIGLDDWLDSMLEGGEGRVVVVTEGIDVREDDDHEEVGHAHVHEDDPHVWHNPQLAKVMVDNIVAALSEADPSNAAAFAQRGEMYTAKLDAKLE